MFFRNKGFTIFIAIILSFSMLTLPMKTSARTSSSTETFNSGLAQALKKVLYEEKWRGYYASISGFNEWR